MYKRQDVACATGSEKASVVWLKQWYVVSITIITDDGRRLQLTQQRVGLVDRSTKLLILGKDTCRICGYKTIRDQDQERRGRRNGENGNGGGNGNGEERCEDNDESTTGSHRDGDANDDDAQQKNNNSSPDMQYALKMRPQSRLTESKLRVRWPGPFHLGHNYDCLLYTSPSPRD